MWLEIISFNVRIAPISQSKRACFYLLSQLQCVNEITYFSFMEYKFLMGYGKFDLSIVSSLREVSIIWLANICEEITKLFLSRLLVCLGLFWEVVALSCFFCARLLQLTVTIYVSSITGSVVAPFLIVIKKLPAN